MHVSTAWNPGSLVSARITPLRLEAFEQLPKHARRCVFWEVDPSTLRADDHLSDPEFEKEAWLSMVMLEWGSCGQIAVQCPDGGRTDGDDEIPPGRRTVPRATRSTPHRAPCRGQPAFPPGRSAPTRCFSPPLGVESGHGNEGLPASLIAAVVGDLVRRGVRALEAFGRTAEVTELLDPRMVPPDLRPAVEVLGDCSVDQCMLDVDLLQDVGFVVVAPHRYFPRLRLELEQGLGWKADVEAALERLLETAQLQQPVGAGSSPCY